MSGSLEAEDQESDGTTVLVKRATISGADGYIVIHADSGGPGPVVGHVRITEGNTKDAVIKLDRAVGGGIYWAMLHKDAGSLNRFEWPGGPDGPVRAQVGLAYVSKKINLAVPKS